MSRILLISFGLAVFVVAGPRAEAIDDGLRTAADRPIDIQHIRLELDVSLKLQTVEGTATISFQPNRTVASVSLDAVGLEVTGVTRRVNGQSESLKFVNNGSKLIISYDSALERGKPQQLTIAYRVRNPKSGLHFFRPTKLDPRLPWMVWSHGEPRSNRYWFPCFDYPNERQTTEVIARVPEGFAVLSNGKLIERKELKDRKQVQYHWKQTKPHVSYLVTLVVGQFEIIRETWRGRPVTYYVMPDRKADAERTFGRTREMLDFFSKRFGIEYPWEKYAQVVVEQFTAGGMENTGATTLYKGVMHDKRALLDSSPDRLIAHELGHQWWGDLVTCRDWSHLWLNEGFATYCEVLWYEHKLGRNERDYLLFQKSRSARKGAALERPIVDRRYSSPRTMFDSRAYPKGGWVLHMLRSRLGDSDFFRGMNRYGVAFSYRVAETSDFRKVFERLYGVSLERFFYDWTERKGHPTISVETVYQPADQLVRIEVRQTQEEEPFRFPLKIVLEGAGIAGRPITIQPGIIKREQSYFVPVKSRPKMIRVDPDFTILAEITEKKSDDWWKRQLQTAPTIAERIRAVEHAAQSGAKTHLEWLAETLKSDPFYGVRIEAATALGKYPTDKSRDELIAGLTQKNSKVRRACAKALAKFSKDPTVEKALLEKHKVGDPSYYVTAAVVESLASVQTDPDIRLLKSTLGMNSHREVIRQAALRGLGKSKNSDALGILIEWSHRGHARMCRIAAIDALASSLSQHAFPSKVTTSALETLAKHLGDSGPRVRRAAVNALAKIPGLAKIHREAIAKLASGDANGRVQVAARDALKAFDAATAPPLDVRQLRTEFDELKRKNQELQKRLERLEKN